MRTKNQKYLYFQNLELLSKEIAFNDAFRQYKNFYFYTLGQVLPSNFPGCPQLSECTFQNPIEQEARGPLAQILDKERPITYVEPDDPSGLVKQYKAHHFFLRSVRKFYHSRLVQWNPTFNDCAGGRVEGHKRISFPEGVPMAIPIRREYQQVFNLPQSTHYIEYAHQPASLQFQMNNLLQSDHSHWPADIIDIHFFLERGQFQMPDLNQPSEYRNIRDCLHSVAEDVDLLEKLKEYRNSAYIYAEQQESINTHIVQKYAERKEEVQEQERIQETVASITTFTLETPPEIGEQEAKPSSSSFVGVHPPLGSLAIYHGTEASPLFGISALLWGTYLAFKIYEFFVPQKETSTNLKDCLFKCGEQKISKDATFEPTLTKL